MTADRPGCPPDNDAYRQFGASIDPDQPVNLDDPVNWGEPLCVLTEDNDSEAWAALPDCEHCGGTGKDLRGSPWEDTR